MSEKTIEDLPGVGPTTAEKLRSVGYDNLLSLAVESPQHLVEVGEIGEATAIKIINAARKEADVGGFITGDVLLEKRKEVKKLTTSSKALDDLLGGGGRVARSGGIRSARARNLDLPPEIRAGTEATVWKRRDCAVDVRARAADLARVP